MHQIMLSAVRRSPRVSDRNRYVFNMIGALDGVGDALTWFGNEPGAFGIPRPIPDYYGVEVERRLDKLVNDEITRVAEERAIARRAERDAPKPK
jgi:hypothetical protein